MAEPKARSWKTWVVKTSEDTVLTTYAPAQHPLTTSETDDRVICVHGYGGIMARFFFAKGEFKTEPQKEMYEVTLDLKDDRVFLEGDYLTRIKCSECHGRDLRGGNLGQDAVPSLVLVKAYNEEEFSILMRTGMARGDREVGFMTELSKTHFVHLTDDEVRDLYQFLLNADT